MVKFLEAIKAGDIQTIIALLEKGESVNVKDSNEITVLHWAVLEEKQEVVAVLLQNGADVNAKDSHDETPLHYAMGCKDVSIGKLLVLISAVNAKNKEGQTPLHRAVVARNVAMVTELLEHGADSNQWDFQGNAPLHLAITQKESLITEILLSHGAAIDIKNRSGKTALHLAAFAGATVMVDRLLRRKSMVNVQDDEGATPLHYAIKKNARAIVRNLLKNASSTTILDKAGNSPAHWIAKASASIELLQLFIKEGGNIHTRDYEGMTPLHWLIARGSVDCASLLIRNGAKVSTRTHDGKTPFHLIGAPVNIPMISTRASIQAIELLLECGEMINVQDNSGKTLLHCTLLQEKRKDAEYTIKKLLDCKADISIQDNDGKTPLHLLSVQNNPRVLELFFKYEIAINAQDNSGKTPLHCAVLTENRAVIGLLLRYGGHIYVNRQDQYDLDTYWPKVLTSDNLLVYTMMLVAGMRSATNERISTMEDKTLRESMQTMQLSLKTTVLNWLKSIVPTHNHAAYFSDWNRKNTVSDDMVSNMLRALPYLIDATAFAESKIDPSCLDAYNRDKFCIEILKSEYQLGVFSELVYTDAKTYRDQYIEFYKQNFQNAWITPALPPNQLSSPAIPPPLKRQRI